MDEGRFTLDHICKLVCEPIACLRKVILKDIYDFHYMCPSIGCSNTKPCKAILCGVLRKPWKNVDYRVLCTYQPACKKYCLNLEIEIIPSHFVGHSITSWKWAWLRGGGYSIVIYCRKNILFYVESYRNNIVRICI